MLIDNHHQVASLGGRRPLRGRCFIRCISPKAIIIIIIIIIITITATVDAPFSLLLLLVLL